MAKTNNSHGSKELDADVIIVGGGHAGCILAALLGMQGLRTVCIDKDDPAASLKSDFDGRTTAISYASKQVIEKAGAWDALIPDACPILDIQITEEESPTLLNFPLHEVDAPAFGWIVENRKLREILFERLSQLPTVSHLAPVSIETITRSANSVTVTLADGRSIRAPLIIGADGKKSFIRDWMGIDTRGWSYNQKAIVSVTEHENPHNNTAWENFRKNGPFAILPMQDSAKGKHRSFIVWTEDDKTAASTLQWSDESFNAAIQERFPSSYGRVFSTGQRFAYPLELKHAHSYIAERSALVSDAAHAIHPIAGQGLNLGLRDVETLARLLGEAARKNEDLGNAALLRQYQKLRYADNMIMAGATDGLNKLFSNNSGMLRHARKLGLRLIQKMPRTRKFFMLQAMGLGQDGLPLSKKA